MIQTAIKQFIPYEFSGNILFIGCEKIDINQIGNSKNIKGIITAIGMYNTEIQNNLPFQHSVFYLENLPEDNKYGIIICDDLLRSTIYENPYYRITKIISHLSPSGSVILVIPNPNYSNIGWDRNFIMDKDDFTNFINKYFAEISITTLPDRTAYIYNCSLAFRL